MTTLEDAARGRDQLPEALPLALRLADEQERALLAVANGEMKIGKLPLEPFVRGYTELRRLQAEVEALRGGWRPIETAPKDGTWVMLWRTPEPEHSPMRSEPMVIARWSDEHGEFVWPDEVCDLFTQWGQAVANSIVDEDCFIWGSDSFTHWQPLTTPPAQEDGK